jgi:hypothetical protein
MRISHRIFFLFSFFFRVNSSDSENSNESIPMPTGLSERRLSNCSTKSIEIPKDLGSRNLEQIGSISNLSEEIVVIKKVQILERQDCHEDDVNIIKKDSEIKDDSLSVGTIEIGSATLSCEQGTQTPSPNKKNSLSKSQSPSSLFKCLLFTRGCSIDTID